MVDLPLHGQGPPIRRYLGLCKLYSVAANRTTGQFIGRWVQPLAYWPSPLATPPSGPFRLAWPMTVPSTGNTVHVIHVHDQGLAQVKLQILLPGNCDPLLASNRQTEQTGSCIDLTPTCRRRLLNVPTCRFRHSVPVTHLRILSHA